MDKVMSSNNSVLKKNLRLGCKGNSVLPDFVNMVNMTHPNPAKGTMLLYYNIKKLKKGWWDMNGKWVIEGLVEYYGHGWVSWGVSETGHMDNGVAVVGFTDDPENLKKYHMFGPDETFTPDNMVPAADGVIDGHVEKTADTTLLYFTKYLEQGEDWPINKDGMNYFIMAGGDGNDLAYHPVRKHFDVDLTRACF